MSTETRYGSTGTGTLFSAPTSVSSQGSLTNNWAQVTANCFSENIFFPYRRCLFFSWRDTFRRDFLLTASSIFFGEVDSGQAFAGSGCEKFVDFSSYMQISLLNQFAECA